MSAFQIVNGYICFNCTDVALAQKDINPAHPPNSPNAPPPTSVDGSGATPGSSNTQGTPAVSFGGSLSQLQGASAVQQPGAAGQTSPTQPNPSPYNPVNGAQASVYA